MVPVLLANSMDTLLETVQMDNPILDHLGIPEEEVIREEEISFLEKRKNEFEIAVV